jgi:hypothetical protein
MAAPTLSSVSPNQGPSSGGTTVTLSGTGFTGVTSIKFGSANATSFTVTSSTQIVAVTPSGTGVVDVTVTTGEGTSAQTVTYTYVAAPVLSSVTPTQGPTSGGTTVILTGAGFTGATAVRFDGTAATAFVVNSPTQITATTPAHAAGAAAVTVTTPGGTSNPDNPPAYFFYAAAPTISGITPDSGSVAGGTTVVLTGTGFTGATAVRFDGIAATFTVNSPTQITATTPAHAAGAAAVTVTTPGGTSNPLTYVFLQAPTLTSLSPNQGPTTGGNSIILTGTNLTTTTSVQFGGTPASFTVISPTQVTATPPAGAAGAVVVTVTTAGGVSNGLAYIRVAGPVI